MGLAASQAKLLSITSRLSDNELRSQSLTAAKLALSSQTADASRKYINALNRNELVYRTYDEAGNKVFVPLTGAQLTSYGEIKNQYGIINNKGQILVSETDAANYKDSANVLEFIQKYGFSNEFKEHEYTALNQEKYNGAMDEYNKSYLEWENNKPKPEDFTKPEVQKYHPNPEPQKTDDKYHEITKTEEVSDLYEKFINSNVSGCFSCSSNPNSLHYNEVRHFNHTLAHLLVDGGPSNALNMTFNNYTGDIDLHSGLWWSVPSGDDENAMVGNGNLMLEIAEAIKDKPACGEQGCEETHNEELHNTPVIFDCGPENCDGNEKVADKIAQLMLDISDYMYSKIRIWGNDLSRIDSATYDNMKASISLSSGSLEDLYQNPGNYSFGSTIVTEEYLNKLTMMYIVGDDNDPEWWHLKERYYHIITHDLKFALTNEEDVFLEDLYNEDHEKWENEWVEEEIQVPDEEAYEEAVENYPDPPEPPNPEDYMETNGYVDQDLKDDTGRWYIDLWHRMNGMSNYKVTMDDFDNGVHDPSSDGLIEGDNVKSPTNGRTPDGLPLWDVLEDGLMNSQEWLKYALETGTVTLERVNYTNPTEYGTGMEPLNNTWTSIVYTNALEISQQVNDRAISIAEAEYEQKTREIEAKDKQYDSMLKLLDTEHSALQQEYESAKAVIQKNTERTLKIYSA